MALYALKDPIRDNSGHGRSTSQRKIPELKRVAMSNSSWMHDGDGWWSAALSSTDLSVESNSPYFIGNSPYFIGNSPYFIGNTDRAGANSLILPRGTYFIALVFGPGEVWHAGKATGTSSSMVRKWGGRWRERWARISYNATRVTGNVKLFAIVCNSIE